MPTNIYEIYIGEVRGNVYECAPGGERIAFLSEEIANERGATV